VNTRPQTMNTRYRNVTVADIGGKLGQVIGLLMNHSIFTRMPVCSDERKF